MRSTIAVSITLGLSLAVAGCDAQQARAKRTISHDLIDPGSAQWRDVGIVKRMTSDGGSISTVCGQINSRNRLGGMVGFSGFAFVTQHNYPSSMPSGSTKVLPEGVYDLENADDDDLAARKNLWIDPFPRYDDRGQSTISALCAKTPIPLPSSLVDYMWMNPCDEFSDGADSIYSYPKVGGMGSDPWVMFKVIEAFPNLEKKNVCHVLVSNYQHWTPLLAIDSGASRQENAALQPSDKSPQAAEILAEAVRLANTARHMSDAEKYY